MTFVAESQMVFSEPALEFCTFAIPSRSPVIGGKAQGGFVAEKLLQRPGRKNNNQGAYLVCTIQVQALVPHGPQVSLGAALKNPTLLGWSRSPQDCRVQTAWHLRALVLNSQAG